MEPPVGKVGVREGAPQEDWDVLERDGGEIWQRLQADLGESFFLGWAHFDGDEAEVEWFPGGVREPRPKPLGG
jgi:hypothetical protein